MIENIQMVDLKRQYLKIKNEVDDAIQSVINSTAFINGPDVKQFSIELAQYLNVKHVIPCANGTDALQIALMALNVKAGDEIILPSFTFMATAEVVALLNLKPVFVDVDIDTYTISIEQVKKAITSKTKVIIPVHLYGQSAAMEELMALANAHGIYVIEDNAQAIGGTYTFANGNKCKTGSMGTIGCTSFFPSKNLGCYGDGGAAFTNDDALAEQMQMIANHGQKIRYYHERVGLNSRLDTIQAAVLRIKLKHLDEYCQARRYVADFYDAAFDQNANIITPYRAPYSYHVFHQYTIKITNVDRDKLQSMLVEKGIPTMLYYPVPCHQQNMMRPFITDNTASLPITNELNKCVLSLPIHTELSTDELVYITNHVNNYINILSQENH